MRKVREDGSVQGLWVSDSEWGMGNGNGECEWVSSKGMEEKVM